MLPQISQAGLLFACSLAFGFQEARPLVSDSSYSSLCLALVPRVFSLQNVSHGDKSASSVMWWVSTPLEGEARSQTCILASGGHRNAGNVQDGRHGRARPASLPCLQPGTSKSLPLRRPHEAGTSTGTPENKMEIPTGAGDFSSECLVSSYCPEMDLGHL